MTAVYDVLKTSYSILSRHLLRQESYDVQLDLCAKFVDDYRIDHPGGGLVKIYEYLRYVVLSAEVEKISRERFVDGMIARGRLSKLSPPKPKTTQSGPYRFDNEARGMIVTAPNQLWVSDTTYYAMSSGQWHYLTFILDVYSRVIIGYAASDSLAADANVAALNMAIEHREAACINRTSMNLVFHSDGGKQFMAKEFLTSLKRVKAKSSMGFVAQENAFAERVNGIIKGEFLEHWSRSRRSLSQLNMHLAKAVDNYNTRRLHNRIPGRICPVDFEKKSFDDLCLDYKVLVKEWNHDPYALTDKFTGTKPDE